MYVKKKGIVVSEYSYLENSKIINIFTRDGIIGVISKGSKKIKSPFFGASNKLTYIEFEITEKSRGLSTLISADIINNYKNIKKDIKYTSYASYITELVVHTYKHEKNGNIYDLYMEALNKINDGVDSEVITDIIELKMLNYLGIAPELNGCVFCGRKTDIITASSFHGGFICKHCLNGDKIVSKKCIQLIRMLYYIDISKITKIDISMEVKKEINEFILEYYDKYSGIYLKSKLLLDKLSKI